MEIKSEHMMTENIKRIETASSFYPQIEKVASIEVLLTEILFRLPVRSLLRFKSVSKHWYSIVVSPDFKLKLLRRPKLEPLSGLFVPVIKETQHPEYEYDYDYDYEYEYECNFVTFSSRVKETPLLECDFVPFDLENPGKAPFRTPKFDPDAKRIDIEHSSNGLILCSSQTEDLTNKYAFTYKYYVYNPTINQFITLPKLENYDKCYKRLGMTLAFDPSKSPHYKVVYVCGLGTDLRAGMTGYQIETYSSETRTCKVSYELALDEEYDVYFGGGVYWNNAIHWVHDKGFMFYFKLDEEIFDHVLTPAVHNHVDPDCYISYIYESCDRLLLAQVPTPTTSLFNIFESTRDYSSWIVLYKVDLEVLKGPFPEVIFSDINPGLFGLTLLSVVVGEKNDDSFVVLDIQGKAVRYNFVSKTCHKLLDFTARPHTSRSIDFDGINVHTPNVFEFTESFYNV